MTTATKDETMMAATDSFAFSTVEECQLFSVERAGLGGGRDNNNNKEKKMKDYIEETSQLTCDWQSATVRLSTGGQSIPM